MEREIHDNNQINHMVWRDEVWLSIKVNGFKAKVSRRSGEGTEEIGAVKLSKLQNTSGFVLVLVIFVLALQKVLGKKHTIISYNFI